ncbi:hypothetical protein N665_0116s0004 [Sinapis alba]|nr:hypothetical protein N665_0116s0004 [Sinapis alba]
MNKHKRYLRSFPQSSRRSCYTFNLTTGDKYLIRAIFLHELRKLTSEAYKTDSGSLQTFLRADIGSFSNHSIRFLVSNSCSNKSTDLVSMEQMLQGYCISCCINNQSSSSEMVNKLFTYEDLAQATNNFARVNFIGQVAIKQLKAGSGQGEREFRAKIEIISRVHHRHLVCLLGYCVTGTQRLLVYEFLPNKTLEFHLHGKCDQWFATLLYTFMGVIFAEKGRPVLDWSKRMKIARGLAYLHEDCNPNTIHRDVKAANVLIDDSYEAKLADFGLAKCCLDTDTHVSTRIMGTCGDKSDVFSFGVMLLELITGRRPVGKSHPFADEENIVDWLALNTGNFHGLVDPGLEKDFDISEIKRMVLCADACVQHSATKRPEMSQVHHLIQGVALGDITSYSLDESSDYSSTEDVKKFKRSLVLESHTFGSSGWTSDNGQSSSAHIFASKDCEFHTAQPHGGFHGEPAIAE